MEPVPLHPAEALFDKYFDQTLTPVEQAQLDAWLCADAKNAERFARWTLAHAQTGEALALLEAAAAAPVAGSLAHQARRKKPVSGGASWPQFALIAASLALALGVGAWLVLRPAQGPAVVAGGVSHPAAAPKSVPVPSVPAPTPPPSVARVDPPSTIPPAPVVKSSSPGGDPSRIPLPSVHSLESALTTQNLQRTLIAIALLGGSSLSAEDGPPPAPVAPDTAVAEAPGLPPPAELPPAATAIAEAEENDPIGIQGLAKMTPSIQGSHKMLLRGEYGDALKRLDDLKTKRLKPEETAAVLKMIEYAYASGLEPQVKAIEDADPLAGLRLLNLMKPPGQPGPYAPRLKERIFAVEAKLRDPALKDLQDAGREFERIYEQYQAYPDEAKPKLEAFVAGHANDPYGAMAVRVLEGKTPVEETDIASADGVVGKDIAEATLLYPSELGGAKGSVPKNQAELKKACVDFLAQSEKVLKSDTADAPECDAKFWKWLDARPAIRTGLLLAKSPVPPMHAINLAKCYKKFGDRACTKYGQLVLAGCLTEADITIGGKNYAPEDISENQRKVGLWLAKNADKVPLWKFYRDGPAKYTELAGGTTEGIGDTAKMAFASRTYPPRINSSLMDNLRAQITHQEMRVPGTHWPLFPVAQTPYILLRPVGQCGLSKRERDFVWGLFSGQVGYPADVPAGELAIKPWGKPRVGTTIGYGKYGFEYTRPDVEGRKSFWHPNTVVRMIEDGGVCGRMATACSIGEVLLGVPSVPAGQPGHCALMTVGFDGKYYGADIGQSVTGGWMNTGPHSPIATSPAISGHEGEAVSWLAMTQTVNRVGMQNYHASLVAAYRADAASDPVEKRNWLELAVRLNPYHMTAIEKIWALAAQDGVNSLNKSMWEAIERLAVKKGKTMDETVLADAERNILRKLVGAHVAAHYDTAMNRAGSVSGQQKEYKLGEGYVAQELTAEQKELAAKAGLAYDEKKEIKQDLELMFRYFLAFQKKGLLYGFTQQVFLKHLSRVDPEIARKMLNQMLEEALKLPLPSNENMDAADTPLFVVIKALTEMDSNLAAKDRAKGLAGLCDRIDKKAPRITTHGGPELIYGMTIYPADAAPNQIYVLVFKQLNKALRECGPEGLAKAENAEKKFDRDMAIKQYDCDQKNYVLRLGAYKALVARTGGAKLNVKPPEVPRKPVFDKDGRVVKPGGKPVSGDPDAERRKRGEGVSAN